MSLGSWLVEVKLINYCSWWWLVEDYKLIPGCLWLSLELESLLLPSNQPNSESEEIRRRSSHYSWFTEKWFNHKVNLTSGCTPKKVSFDGYIQCPDLFFDETMKWSHVPYGHFGSRTLIVGSTKMMVFGKPVFSKNKNMQHI